MTSTWSQRYRDNERNRALQDQADATERQNRLIEQQLEAEQRRFEFMQEVQRAADLGISHQEYKRRLQDVTEAETKLANAKRQLTRLREAVSNPASIDRTLAKSRRKRTRRKIRALYWRNRWNWIRHPRMTSAAIKPHVDRIRTEVEQADHAQVQKARATAAHEQQLVAAAESVVQAAESELARRQSRV